MPQRVDDAHASDERSAPSPPSPDADAPLPTPDTAMALVTRLWQTASPNVWTPGRRAATERPNLPAILAQLAHDADTLATSSAPEERIAAALLGETARAISAAFAARGGAAPLSPASELSAESPSAEGRALPSPLRLRLARMECWLTTRAQTDRTAEAASTLCLWALEHLEGETA